MVREVDLLEANSHYAHVRFPDGRETTVSSKHLALFGVEQDVQPSVKAHNDTEQPDYQKQLSPENTLNSSSETKLSNVSQDSPSNDNSPTSSKSPAEPITLPRRSNRVRRPPDRFYF